MISKALRAFALVAVAALALTVFVATGSAAPFASTGMSSGDSAYKVWAVPDQDVRSTTPDQDVRSTAPDQDVRSRTAPKVDVRAHTPKVDVRTHAPKIDVYTRATRAAF